MPSSALVLRFWIERRLYMGGKFIGVVPDNVVTVREVKETVIELITP
jgi:hypothetical protein